MGHPDFGKAHPCRCQTQDPEYLAARYRERVGNSGLPPTLRTSTLASFRPRPDLREAVAVVRDAIDRQERGGDPLWVVLFGAPGVGKTHLLAAVANALLTRQRVTWWSLPALLQACKATGDQGGESRPFAEDQALTATAQQAEVLILDEVGSGATLDRGWAWSKLDLILKARYVHRQPLFLGMSCTPDELAEAAPALFSRLQDKTLVRVVAINATDYRPHLKAAG